jgi:hypothetical protein
MTTTSQETVEQGRQPYEAPALVEFGSITELTQAGGASQVEGQTPIPNKKT